jgi:hypothetical protein
VDPLAKQQACQLFIKQEIEKGKQQGKSSYATAKQMVPWLEKLFGVTIKLDTLKKRAQRIYQKFCTNVPTGKTIENDYKKNGI